MNKVADRRKAVAIGAIAVAAVIAALVIAGAFGWPKGPALALKAPSEVRQGESLEGLDVVMTNRRLWPLRFSYGASLLDFEVLDEKGSASRATRRRRRTSVAGNNLHPAMELADAQPDAWGWDQPGQVGPPGSAWAPCAAGDLSASRGCQVLWSAAANTS